MFSAFLKFFVLRFVSFRFNLFRFVLFLFVSICFFSNSNWTCNYLLWRHISSFNSIAAKKSPENCKLKLKLDPEFFPNHIKSYAKFQSKILKGFRKIVWKTWPRMDGRKNAHTNTHGHAHGQRHNRIRPVLWQAYKKHSACSLFLTMLALQI